MSENMYTLTREDLIEKLEHLRATWERNSLDNQLLYQVIEQMKFDASKIVWAEGRIAEMREEITSLNNWKRQSVK